jgi:hypothetical protein
VHGTDLRARLTGVDDDNHLAAISECFSAWYLAGRRPFCCFDIFRCRTFWRIGACFMPARFPRKLRSVLEAPPGIGNHGKRSGAWARRASCSALAKKSLNAQSRAHASDPRAALGLWDRPKIAAHPTNPRRPCCCALGREPTVTRITAKSILYSCRC